MLKTVSKRKNKKEYKLTNKLEKNNSKKLLTYKDLKNNYQCGFINLSKKKNKNNKSYPKIALEEAFTWPNQEKEVWSPIPMVYLLNQDKLSDIIDNRIKQMNKDNIKIQVLSVTSPGTESLKNGNISYIIKKCQSINNYIANEIKNHKNRFKVFACLPMRSPKAAAKELERCVKELGFVGALVNGYDDCGKKKPIYFDTKDYDILWKKFVELNVPLYMHPRVFLSNGSVFESKDTDYLYDLYPEIHESAWGFHDRLALHVLRLLISGIFERNPDLKLILGHAGEILPWWAERFEHRLCLEVDEYHKAPVELKKKYNPQYPKLINKFHKKQKGWIPRINYNKLLLSSYFKKNIYITTSGFFSDSALKYLLEKYGEDRVLFAVDYPYEIQSQASKWLDNINIKDSTKRKIAYKNAEKLLKI